MKLFYCYSYPLKEFLLENKQQMIITSIHDKTKKKFWVFTGCDELNNLLTVWKLRKP